MVRPFFVLFLVLCPMAQIDAQSHYEKGQVISSIPVSNTTDETFALYLPQSYSDTLPQPIIFIYDPMGRGKVGIQAFMPAAEKYGLILVCSNNSRNAPYARNFDISNNLFNHIFSHFNIKDDEMFASGFSGGSRLAGAIASLTDKFAGVVGCGAGFSGLQEHTPSTQKYAYVGLCGNRDMNYAEMIQNRDYLNLINFKNTLITFDGIHRWPPAEQIVRAFDWLYLQRSLENQSNGQDTIMSFYKSDYDLLHQFLDKDAFLFANEQYRRMIADYKPVFSMDSIENRYRQFKKGKGFKKKSMALEKAIKQEVALLEKYRTRFAEEFVNTNVPDFNWWEKEVNKLGGLAEKEDVEIQKMAARIKFALFAMAFERKSILPKTSNEGLMAALDELISITYPR